MKEIAKAFLEQNFTIDKDSKKALEYSLHAAIPKLIDVIIRAATSEAIEWVGLTKIGTDTEESVPALVVLGGRGMVANFKFGFDGVFTSCEHMFTRTDALNAMVLNKQNPNPGELYNVVFL